MTNYFEVLNLPVTLVLSPEAVESAWRELTNSSAGTQELDASPADRNQARATLSNETARLEHWLALKNPELQSDSTIAPGLMDLFSEIQPAITSTDELIALHRKASTALAKAVLTKDTIAAQLKIQTLLGSILEKKTALIDIFSELEEAASAGDFSASSRTLTQLKFLSRWEQQCQERLLALINT